MAQLNNSANGGPRQSTFFSQAARDLSAAVSDCESGVGEADSVAGTTNGDRPNGSTLSISFDEPLTGPQRLGLIQRIVETHVSSLASDLLSLALQYADHRMLQPAFRTAQLLQECIYKTQTSLRRMPGVASLEAKEVGERLQETSRLVSREYASLLEQHARMTLDFKETKLSAERSTQDAILNKHQLENMTSRLDKLFHDYVTERERRERYEQDIRGITEYMGRLGQQLRGVMGKVLAGCEAGTHAEVAQDLEGVVASLDEKARTTPCGWGSSSSSGSGSAGIKTPLSSTALVRTAEPPVPMSPANKEAVTSRLKAMGLLDPDGDTQRPGSVMGRPMFNPPRTPVNGRSMVPAFDRPPTRNSFTPMTAGASPRPGHYNNRSRGSTFSMSSNNFGAGGPRSRAGSVSNNAMPFQPPPSFNGGMKSLRGGGSGFFNQHKNQSNNYGFPNLDLTHAPSRPGTAFEGFRDSRSNLNGRADSFPSSSAASTNGLVLTPPTSSSSSSAAMLTDHLVQQWQVQIRVFYKSLHAWVERFASPDQPTPESLGGTGVWPVLLKSYRPLSPAEAASYLEIHLKDSLSRYCLVTRVIVDYVVNLVWMVAGWKGADIPSTDALTVLEKDLKAVKGESFHLPPRVACFLLTLIPDRPAYERQPLLNRQAELVESILREFPNFIADKTKNAVSSILANLGPILVRPCSNRPATTTNGTNGSATNSNNIRAEASAQLRDIIRQAYEISEIMMTSRITFDFRFPLVGSRFTSQSMVNIWPSAVDPLELQAKHWRVALVVSPVITCRSDTGTDISAHAVASADVFCMQ